nr:hypothetical protein [Tanacetum cinerariifolium]
MSLASSTLRQLEALNQMPKLAKVLKDLLSIKAKLESATSSLSLSEECSSAIQKNLYQKEGNPLQPRELLSQLGSWSKVGSGSGVRGKNGSGGGRDDDADEDKEAEH